MQNQETKKVTIHGEEFTVSVTNNWDAKFWQGFDGSWEPKSFDFLKKHIKPGIVFVDIGAWIGPLSLFAHRLGARIIALEPDPVAREALQRNAELNDVRMDILAAAFDSTPGTMTLHADKRGLGASITSSFSSKSVEKIEVPCVDTKSLIKKIDGNPSVIKIDMEGHEYNVASDIKNLWVETGAPIQLSVHPRILYENIKSENSTVNFLMNSKQKVVNLTLDLMHQFDDRITVDDAIVKMLNPRPFVRKKRIRNFEAQIVPFQI